MVAPEERPERRRDWTVSVPKLHVVCCAMEGWWRLMFEGGSIGVCKAGDVRLVLEPFQIEVMRIQRNFLILTTMYACRTLTEAECKAAFREQL